MSRTHRPRRGHAGHLTGVALATSSSRGTTADVGARRERGLGGREAPRPRHPHDGLAAAPAAEVPRIWRLLPLPDGRRHDLDRLGGRTRLPRRELSVHDMLQEFKTHPMISTPAGRRARRVGRQDDPERRHPFAAERLHAPGLLCAATASASSTSRRSRASTTRSSRAGSPPSRRSPRSSAARRRTTSLGSYDEAIRDSFIWQDLYEVRDMRQVFGRGFFVGGAFASAMTIVEGPDRPRGRCAPSRTPTSRCCAATGSESYPAPDGNAHLRQALVRLRLGQQDARRPAEPHPHRAARAARGGRALGALCPAQVYELGDGGRRRHGRPCSSPRRTASSAARSRPRAAGSPRPRAAPDPSTP